MNYMHMLLFFRSGMELVDFQNARVPEALDNMALRESITCHPNVTVFYRKFLLEDGSAVVLDAALAFTQVKQCLNDLK